MAVMQPRGDEMREGGWLDTFSANIIFQLEGESILYSFAGDGDRSIGSEIQLCLDG